MANDLPPYVGIDWIAEKIGVTPFTIRQWVRSDLMPKPVCTRSTYRWRLKELLRWRPGLADASSIPGAPNSN